MKGFRLREVLVGWVDDRCVEGADLCEGVEVVSMYE